MAGFTNTGNHRLATAVEQQFTGLDKVVIQACQQALRFGQLNFQRFTGKVEQGSGVTHQGGLLPE
ncbi:hypothetical protein D3C81_2309580 [compost metagenome]